MDEQAIRQLILHKLAQGELPSSRSTSTWGGTCEKALPCSACDQTIEKGEIEVEAEYSDGLTRHYHPTCHHLLESERLRKV